MRATFVGLREGDGSLFQNLPDREDSAATTLQTRDLYRSGKFGLFVALTSGNIPIGKMTPKEVGETIRNVRLNQGLRQDQLAAAAGVGVRFVVELERGKPTVQLGRTLAVLAALGCRVSIIPPNTPAAKQ